MANKPGQVPWEKVTKILFNGTYRIQNMKGVKKAL